MKLSEITEAKIEEKKEPKQGRLKFALIYSKLLEEEIVLVTEKEYYKEAKQCYPGRVIYFIREALGFIRSDAETIKNLHLLKKEFGGWITRKKVQER